MTPEPAPRPATSAEHDCLARIEGGVGWLVRKLEHWHLEPEAIPREMPGVRLAVSSLLADIRRTTGGLE